MQELPTAVWQQPQSSDGELASVLATEQLGLRTSRAPDHKGESQALSDLARTLSEDTDSILQKLVAAILSLLGAGSAGISLISKDTGDFYWPAIAGKWSGYVGGGTPRHFGPCAVVLERNAVQLFASPERYYTYLQAEDPLREVLLSPFDVDGVTVGTVWAVAHDEDRHFDSEDSRLLVSLGTFAACAYKALAVREELRAELEAAQLLQQLSLRSPLSDGSEAPYDDILDAAVAIMNAEYGSIQVFYPERGHAGELYLLTARGYEPSSVPSWEWISIKHYTSCAQALRTGQRSIVPDVERCEWMADTPDLDLYLQAGVRSLQSTPLISRGGKMLGMISTCWKKPHEPSHRELRMLDTLARQAADVLDRLNVEKALRHSHEATKKARYFAEATLQTSPVPLMVLEKDLRVVTANQAFFTKFGGSPDATCGRLFDELNGGEWNIPELRCLLEQALERDAAAETFEVSHAFSRVGRRSLLLHARRMEVEEAGPERIVLTLEDITDRKQVEERKEFLLLLSDALRTSEEAAHAPEISSRLLGEFLGADRVGYAETGSEPGTMEVQWDWTSPGTDSIVGSYRIEDFGRFFAAPMRQGSPAVIEDALNDARLTKEEFEAPWGAIGVRAVIAYPLVKHGQLLSAFFVHQTGAREWTPGEILLVTEVGERTWAALERSRSEEAHRETESRVRLLNEQLEAQVDERTADLLRANEQLQGFSYSVAHDLRQQIRGISSNASMLLLDAATELEETNRTTLMRMVRSSQKLAVLVDELLQYAQLGKREPTISDVDLTELSREVAEHIADTSLAERLPRFEIAAGLVARGDAAMLKIVMQNLIENAAKYSREDTETFIEIGCANGAFFVRDNGIGFDMQYAHKLFNPFERLHRDSEYSGTGIGLANVKRIVEKHGGRVWPEGTPGEGATFYFTLG